MNTVLRELTDSLPKDAKFAVVTDGSKLSSSIGLKVKFDPSLYGLLGSEPVSSIISVLSEDTRVAGMCVTDDGEISVLMRQ